MTWEIVEGVVCLKEVSLVTNLMNSNVCIRFGGMSQSIIVYG